jgi:type IV secretion system protein TrbL
MENAHTQSGELDMVRRRFVTSLGWECYLSAFFLVLLFASASGAAVETGDFADSMLLNFKTQFANYENSIWLASRSLFYFLFLCQFVWSLVQLCLHESLTFASVIAVVIRQIMTGMFFWWLLFDRSILRSIVGSFSQLAYSGLELTELIGMMEISVQNIMAAAGRSAGILNGIALFLTGLAASVIMSFALTTAIAYMAVVMIENYIVGSLGLILMGFAGSDYTRNYAISYIHTLVHVGLKLFLATIIVNVGVIAFTQTTMGLTNMDSDSVSQTCMQLIAQSFFFLAITRIIPEVAATLVSGASSSGMHTLSAIQAGGGAIGTADMRSAAAVAGVTAGVDNTPGAVADVYNMSRNAIQNAANAYNERYLKTDLRREHPAAAGTTAIGGVVGGLWDKYQAKRHSRDPQWVNAMSAPPPAATAPTPTTPTAKNND